MKSRERIVTNPLAYLSVGKHFYTDKEDKHVQSEANYWKVHVKTERILCLYAGDIYNNKPFQITKVTILERDWTSWKKQSAQTNN